MYGARIFVGGPTLAVAFAGAGRIPGSGVAAETIRTLAGVCNVVVGVYLGLALVLAGIVLTARLRVRAARAPRLRPVVPRLCAPSWQGGDSSRWLEAGRRRQRSLSTLAPGRVDDVGTGSAA